VKTAGTLVILCCGGCALGTPRVATDLEPVLRRHLAASAVAPLGDAAAYRVQVLISAVETVPGRAPGLKRSGYRLNAEYFYPASAIKLAAAVAALQTIERLGATNGSIDLADTPLEIAPLFDGDRPQWEDSTNLAGGRITVAHEIRKLALVSDNQAFNRLYDLVGYDELNAAMRRLGFGSTVITHRLSETRTIPDPRASAAVTFHPPGRAPIVVPARTSARALANSGPGLLIGTGYIRGVETIREPMDFTRRNGMSLPDLQDLLVKVARPDIDVSGSPLRLTAAHRALLLDAMTRYPAESSNPVYAPATFPDDVSKFLLTGIRRVFPSTLPGDRIEITGKVGQAYGFTVENSYVRNLANGRAVFVSAVIYTNSDGVLNDDQYEYDSVGRPFMAELGRLVANEWLR
jgi:hypothetical protein